MKKPKYKGLADSIIEHLNSLECTKEPTKTENEYIIWVDLDDWNIANILVNENNHEIFISFHCCTDPAVIANVALIMGGFAHMEIYESYRFNEESEMLWWHEDTEEWEKPRETKNECSKHLH